MYYHGLMPREDVEQLLENDGDFLVRRTDVQGAIKFILTLKWGKRCQHFFIYLKTGSGGDEWYLRSTKTFKTIPDLVEYYKKTHESLTAEGKEFCFC